MKIIARFILLFINFALEKHQRREIRPMIAFTRKKTFLNI